MSSGGPLRRRYNDWDGCSEAVGSNVEHGSRSASPVLDSQTASLPHWAQESGLNPHAVSSQVTVSTQASQARPQPDDPPPAAAAAAASQQQQPWQRQAMLMGEQAGQKLPQLGSAPSSGNASEGAQVAIPGMLSLSQPSRAASTPRSAQPGPANALQLPRMWDVPQQEAVRAAVHPLSQPSQGSGEPCLREPSAASQRPGISHARLGLLGGGSGQLQSPRGTPSTAPGGGASQPDQATPARPALQGADAARSPPSRQFKAPARPDQASPAKEGPWSCKWANKLQKGDARLGRPCQRCGQEFGCARS
jgi:hypothetical protein